MRHRFRPILFAFVLIAGVSAAPAQTVPSGDENPTANTGALKAQIETGGSYDANSGNATRIIPDLHFPGAVGVYGLDFTRYFNSLRNDRDPGNEYLHPEPIPEQPTDFGSPGWSHSWSWNVAYDEYLQEVGGDGGDEIYTMMLTITFPDGHASKYKIIRTKLLPLGQTWPPDPRFGPPYYAAHGETNWTPSGDIHDYLDGMAENGSEFWLHRADGGTVHFVDSGSGYQATQVLDPHGLLTTLHYNADGNLDWVEQDGGRRLTIRWDCYSPPGQQNPCMEKVIGRVENAGATMQAVEYGYSWLGDSLTLTHAYYQNDPVPGQSVAATYTYESYTPPSGFFYGGPLLVTADDPRFAGPMRQIRYSYRGAGCLPTAQPSPGYQDGQFDYFYASPTSIAAEKSWRTISNVPIVVSSFTLGCFDGTRSESNGLGGFRKFFYGRSAGAQGTYHCLGYQLAKLTDFTNVYPLPSNLPFERQNYLTGEPREIWDGRGILTEPVYGDGSGFPSEVHHTGSDGSSSTYDRVNPGNSEAQDFSRVPNPYHHWLFSKSDERSKTTVYTRDSRRRVKHIAYDNGSAEDFTYDPVTNQVTSHTLPSGAVQHYEYNGSNQLQREWNSVDGEAAATTYTYYGGSNRPEWTGLVATELNARAAANGAAYSTMMEYNGRFQITKVHYPPTGGNSDPTISYGYDANGNCISITDELGHTSLYEYDDYRRCTSYTEPLNASNWNGSGIEASRRWDWIYDRYIEGVGLRDAYAHTKNEWRIQIEPAFNSAGDRRMTARTHDLQNRISTESTGWIQPAGPIGNWYWSPTDGENHTWTYDENGQKKTYTDPQGRLTTYTYDLRNRLKDTIETKRADQSVNPTTTILYDTTNNKTDVTFPDNRSQHWQDYDPFGQAWTFFDERANRTDLSYCWGPMKKLCTVTTHRAKDGGGTEDQQTVFWFDPMGRPTEVHFPLPDGSTEISTYEFGQLKTWKTRKNQTKTIVYDARGREVSHSWNDGATPAISRSWDDANRLGSITNIWSSIDFGYDDAGQVIWEGDEIAGSGGRTQTNYYRYPDGSEAHLHYPGGAYVRNDYTARGQLAATGWDDDDNNWWMKLAAYIYLADGKVGQVDYGNGMRSALGYDERGFTKIVDHYNVPLNQDRSWRQYWRDDRDRITAFQKSYNPGANPLDNGRGDRFHYDDEGQLLEGWYNAIDPANSGAGNTRYDGFSYDALGNRGQGNYVASRGQMDFTKKDNGLNQYRAWLPYSYTNYDDDIGGTWGAPGAANGVLMQDGWVTAGFNALNQPMYIWSPIYNGTSNWMYFGYDPLGRCVKRWVGDSGDVYSNPATYFHYDGWNLLQEGANAWGPARVYVHGNRVDEIVWSYNTFTGDQAFHHYDARGHATLLTDSSSNILEQYEYDAFGWPYFYDSLGDSTLYSIFGNRFLFGGREWLADLRLFDFRARMYQPELGRFLQPDPKQFAAGDYNLYRYCHNDPVNRSDPFGLLDQDQDDRIVREITRPVLGSSIPLHIRYVESGNWNDKKIANHYDSSLESKTGRGGQTIGKARVDTAGSNVNINLRVNWFVDTKYRDTTVVTRELEHIQGFRDLSKGIDASLLSSRLSTSYLNGLPASVRSFSFRQQLQYDWPPNSGKPHDLKANPAMPVVLPEDETTR